MGIAKLTNKRKKNPSDSTEKENLSELMHRAALLKEMSEINW